VSIVVNIVDDSPIVALSGGSTPFTENGPAVVVDAGLTVSDVDSPGLTGATVQIAGGYQSGLDTLTFTPSGGITGSFDPATGTLTLGGTTTAANYRTVLRSVTFVTTSDNPGTTRTITFAATDGNSFGTGAPRTIAVTPINDAPVVTTAGGSAAYVENALPLVADATLVLADPDNASLTGATVQITGGYVSGEDILGFTSAGGITGSFDPATGTLTLSGTATVADYQTALRTVIYANASDSPSTSDRTLTFSAFDGAATGTGAVRTITVTATNDAPINRLPFGPVFAFEDTPRAIAGVNVSDADAGTGTVVVTLAVTRGVLTISTGTVGGVTAGQVSGNGTRSVTLTGTVAAINATLADGIGPLYIPDPNTNGNDTLTITTDDQGNSDGPARSDTDPITIAVREVNDPAAARDDVLAGTSADAGARSITFASLTGNDARGPANESAQSLTITSVGNAVGGTVAISGANVVFTPDPNFSGTASFTYTVRDNGTTGGLFAPTTATATASFDVAARAGAAPALSKPKDSAFAVGLGAGQPAFAALFGADGSLRFFVNAMPGFTGGVSAAAGDVNGDARADLVVGFVLGGFNVIEVFDGNTGGLMHAFFAFPAFATAAVVGADDVNNDGYADIFIGPAFGTPLFGVFSGRDQTYLGLGGLGGTRI
jgi:hypothetical protein